MSDTRRPARPRPVHPANKVSSAEKKASFVALYAGGEHSLEAASLVVGVSRGTIFNWRKTDAEFDSAIVSARAEADAGNVEKVENWMVKHILSGEAAPVLAMFYLTNRGGDRWRHVSHRQVSGPNGEALQLGDQTNVTIYLPDNGRQDAADIRDAEITEIVSKRLGNGNGHPG